MAFGPIGILRYKQFDVFKDYFGLANVLKEIQEEKASGNCHHGSFMNRPCQSLPNKPTVPALNSTLDPRPVSVDQKIDSAVCAFCNGEHRLKNPYSGKITCPVLRSYTLPVLSAMQPVTRHTPKSTVPDNITILKTTNMREKLWVPKKPWKPVLPKRSR